MFNFIIKASDLADLTTAGAFATTNSSRPLLTGILLEVTRDGERVAIKATATDLYRVAMITRDGETPNGIDDGATVSVLISAKGMAAAVKSACKDAKKTGGVRVTVDADSSRVTFAAAWSGALEYPAEIIDGTYPEMGKVIPADSFYANSDGVTAIALSPHLVATFAKLAPWSAKSPTDAMKMEFIDGSRPVRVASRDRRTVALIMPVRVQ